MTFEQRIDWFSARNLIMLFLWKDRFLNPLVPEQLQKLKSSGLLDNKYLLKVLEEYLPELDAELPRGMYFPVPISRSLSEGEEFSTKLAGQFFYDFIRVDDCQKGVCEISISLERFYRFLSQTCFTKREPAAIMLNTGVIVDGINATLNVH